MIAQSLTRKQLVSHFENKTRPRCQNILISFCSKNRLCQSMHALLNLFIGAYKTLRHTYTHVCVPTLMNKRGLSKKKTHGQVVMPHPFQQYVGKVRKNVWKLQSSMLILAKQSLCKDYYFLNKYIHALAWNIHNVDNFLATQVSPLQFG